MSFFNYVLKRGEHSGLHEAILNLTGPKVCMAPPIEGRAARAARLASERIYNRAPRDKLPGEPVPTIEEVAPVAAALMSATKGVVTDHQTARFGQSQEPQSSVCAALTDRPRLKRSTSAPSTTQRAKMARRDGVPSPSTLWRKQHAVEEAAKQKRAELSSMEETVHLSHHSTATFAPTTDEQSAADAAESSAVVMQPAVAAATAADTATLTASGPNQSTPKVRTKQVCPMRHGDSGTPWIGDGKRTKSMKNSKCHSHKHPHCKFEPFGVTYLDDDLQIAKQKKRDECEKQGLDAASKEAKRAVSWASRTFFQRLAVEAHEGWRAGRGPASFSQTDLGANECVREVSVVVPDGCDPGDYFAHLDPKRKAIVYTEPTLEQQHVCYKSSTSELASYQPGAHSAERTWECPIGPVPNPRPAFMKIMIWKRSLRPSEEWHRSLSATFDNYICGDSDGGGVAGNDAGSDGGSVAGNDAGSDGGSDSDGSSDSDEEAEKAGGRGGGGLGEGGGGGGLGDGSGGGGGLDSVDGSHIDDEVVEAGGVGGGWLDEGGGGGSDSGGGGGLSSVSDGGTLSGLEPSAVAVQPNDMAQGGSFECWLCTDTKPSDSAVTCVGCPQHTEQTCGGCMFREVCSESAQCPFCRNPVSKLRQVTTGAVIDVHDSGLRRDASSTNKTALGDPDGCDKCQKTGFLLICNGVCGGSRCMQCSGYDWPPTSEFLCDACQWDKPNAEDAARQTATLTTDPATALTVPPSDVQCETVSSSNGRIEAAVVAAKQRALQEGLSACLSGKASRAAESVAGRHSCWAAVQHEMEVEPAELLKLFKLSDEACLRQRSKIIFAYSSAANGRSEAPPLTEYTPITSGWNVLGGMAAKDFKLIVGSAMLDLIIAENGLPSLDIVYVKTSHGVGGGYCVLVTEIGAMCIVTKARSMTFEAAERARASKLSTSSNEKAVKVALDGLNELGLTNLIGLALPDTRNLTTEQMQAVRELYDAIRNATVNGIGDDLLVAITNSRTAIEMRPPTTQVHEIRHVLHHTLYTVSHSLHTIYTIQEHLPLGQAGPKERSDQEDTSDTETVIGNDEGAGPSSGAAATPSGQLAPLLPSFVAAERRAEPSGAIEKRAKQGAAPLEQLSQLSPCRGGNGAGQAPQQPPMARPSPPPTPTGVGNKRKVGSLAEEQPTPSALATQDVAAAKRQLEEALNANPVNEIMAGEALTALEGIDMTITKLASTGITWNKTLHTCISPHHHILFIYY